MVVPILKNVEERPNAKNYRTVSLLYAVGENCKVFKRLGNNRILDNLENWDLFLDLQYDLRSFRSREDPLIVVSNRIARPFKKSGTILNVALDISKAFDRVWHAVLFHKLKSYGISG